MADGDGSRETRPPPHHQRMQDSRHAQVAPRFVNATPMTARTHAAELYTPGTLQSIATGEADPLTPTSRRVLESATKKIGDAPIQSISTPAASAMATRGEFTTTSAVRSNDGRSPHVRLQQGMANVTPKASVFATPVSAYRTTSAGSSVGVGALSMASGKAPGTSGHTAASFGGAAAMYSGARSPATSSAWSNSTGSRIGAGGVPSSFGASAALLSVSTSTGAASTSSVVDDSKDRSRCGAGLWFRSPIRLRLNNHQCLRLAREANDSASANGTSSVSASTNALASTNAGPGTPGNATAIQSVIDVRGSGLGDAADEIFELVNANNRGDDGEVHYSDVVSIYCTSGSAMGRFLSADAHAKTIDVKRGPVITNAEKWRIVNPAIPADKREEPPLFADSFASLGASAATSTASSLAAKIMWEQKRAMVTSDRLLLKMCNADLFLSVRHDASTAIDAVVLRPETDRDSGVESLKFEWELVKANVPFDPQWNREREYLVGDAPLRRSRKPDSAFAEAGDANVRPLSGFPPSEQQRMVVDDLLDSFLGEEGRYIKLEVAETILDSRMEHSFRFVLPEHGMDPSIAALARRCFPLGECFLKLALFVEQASRYEYGQVSHAFAQGLSELLSQYKIGIAKMDYQMRLASSTSEPLTLQKLWLYIQPSLQSFALLTQLTDGCRHSLSGGSLLSAIGRIKASLTQDGKTLAMLSFLMQCASAPYLKMVEKWIYAGELNDPYDEFMVRCDPELHYDDLIQNPYSTYWRDRFTLRASQVPLFLSSGADKILATGKYLNVFKTCDRVVHCPNAAPIPFSEEPAAYEELIDRAHDFASRTLREFIVDDHDLANRLASVKHYFLMDQGDFFVDFMDAAEQEMLVDSRKIPVSRLESLLHMSLQTSTCAPDPYRDDLVCLLSRINLLDHLTSIHERARKAPRDAVSSATILEKNYRVVDTFSLDYRVKWPLSLVISCGELTKYQLLFRHLFYCKHVEKRLGDAWQKHMWTKELDHVRGALGKSLCLRQRMLHFQQNLLYYMMVEVISPRWHALQRELEQAQTLDDILEHHQAFLDWCLKECLLSDADLLNVIYKLMELCNSLVQQLERVTEPYFFDDETIRAEREQERGRRAEKRAREEADAAVMNFDMASRPSKAKKSTAVSASGGVRRGSAYADARRTRLAVVSEGLHSDLTVVHEGQTHNAFQQTTRELEHKFDSQFQDFMNQLLRRSRLQRDAHLSNLCTRLDYNGYYTSKG